MDRNDRGLAVVEACRHRQGLVDECRANLGDRARDRRSQRGKLDIEVELDLSLATGFRFDPEPDPNIGALESLLLAPYGSALEQCRAGGAVIFTAEAEDALQQVMDGLDAEGIAEALDALRALRGEGAAAIARAPSSPGSARRPP